MAVAGDILSFDWNFLTSQSPSSSFNDFGLFTLDGTASKLGDTFSPTVGSGTTFIDETGSAHSHSRSRLQGCIH